MTDEPDRDLPLHAEAKARAEWRGGETIIEGGGQDGLPASEADEAVAPRAPSGGGESGAGAPTTVPPPD